MPQDQVKERAEDAGLRGYLLKPFRIGDLLEIVRSSISRPSHLPQAV
jgi:DNA-binding NarL/FixJ family response regulator